MTLTPYNVPVCSGTQNEQHQDSFSNMAVFLFKSCYPKRYCACLISMCFHGMLHHTCITCHNIHHRYKLFLFNCIHFGPFWQTVFSLFWSTLVNCVHFDLFWLTRFSLFLVKCSHLVHFS